MFIAGGFEPGKDGAAPMRRSRIPVAEFGAAISIGGREVMDSDEVECLLSTMIYKVCVFHAVLPLFSVPVGLLLRSRRGPHQSAR